MAKDYLKEILDTLKDIVKLLSNNKSTKTSVDGRFIDCGDGTIKDTKTNLMWHKDGSQERKTYSEAEKYCESSDVGSFKDWRLPTREELESILDLKKYDPAINPLFNARSEYYWTSTPCASGTGGAWIVGFGSGGVSWDGSGGYSFVRPVRQY